MKAWSGSLDIAFGVDEASVKDAQLRCAFFLVSAVLTFRLCFWLRGDLVTCAH